MKGVHKHFGFLPCGKPDCEPQDDQDETHRETPLRRYAVSDEPSGNDSPRSVKDHRPGCLAYGKPYANGCDCGAARINKAEVRNQETPGKKDNATRREGA